MASITGQVTGWRPGEKIIRAHRRRVRSWPLICLLAVVVLVVGCRDRRSAVIGRWDVERVEVNGQPVVIPADLRFTFSGLVRANTSQSRDEGTWELSYTQAGEQVTSASNYYFDPHLRNHITVVNERARHNRADWDNLSGVFEIAVTDDALTLTSFNRSGERVTAYCRPSTTRAKRQRGQSKKGGDTRNMAHPALVHIHREKDDKIPPTCPEMTGERESSDHYRISRCDSGRW